MAAIAHRASELRLAFETLATIAEAAADLGGFARAGVVGLPRLVACDLATFSACRLDSGHREVIGDQYRRPLRIKYVMAMPLHVDDRLLVSFVFNRCSRAFDERERALLDLLRPQLAALYRCLRQVGEPAAGAGLCGRLTAREAEVLTWVAAGKVNRDIAAILGASVRTIEKHLEHAYEKLGVETRTAAVMRFSARPPLAVSAQPPDARRLTPD